MQILAFNFDKISAERKDSLKGKVEINSNINITSITSEKVAIVKDESSVALKFNFDFTVAYNPDFAELKFTGSILTVFDKEESKEVLKKWKDKKISDNVRIVLFNFILTKCNLKALQLEEDINIPTHVPLPKIMPPENKEKSYTG